MDIGYGSGFKKGSAEAKAHMAKIRAMRKKKKGDGIMDDIVSAISGGKVLDNVPTFRRPIKGSVKAREE